MQLKGSRAELEARWVHTEHVALGSCPLPTAWWGGTCPCQLPSAPTPPHLVPWAALMLLGPGRFPGHVAMLAGARYTPVCTPGVGNKGRNPHSREKGLKAAAGRNRTRS